MILVNVEGSHGKELLKLETCSPQTTELQTDNKKYKDDNRLLK